VRTPQQGLPRYDHSVQLGCIAHRDDLPSILRHLAVDETHLLVAQVTTAQILLRETRKELGITAAETNAVVVTGDLRRLLIGSLVLLIDADQSLQRPHLVGGELILDVLDGVFLGGVHLGHTLTYF